MKKQFFILVAVLLALPTMSLAAEFKGGNEVLLNEVINDDLYIGAELARVSESVEGDLLIAGGKTNVDGNVAGD